MNIKYVLIFLLLIIPFGCSSPAQPLELPFIETSPPAPVITSHSRIIGTTVEGRPIECHFLGHNSPTILFLAGIHGDEAAGVPLLHRLHQELNADPALFHNRRVVIVPNANPDAVTHNRRHNVRGVDINRNFPARNHRPHTRHGEQPLSEPESRVLHDLINQEQPSVIVTLHQPIACVDYDGPALELAQRISDLSGLPVNKLGARPGSLGSWAGVDQNIAVITLELPGRASHITDDILWQTYGPALLSALRD